MTFRARSSVSLIWAIALTMVLSTVPLRPVQAQTDQTKPAASDAQKEKEAEQRKELEKKTLALLNDVAAGAWSLKLPENRLFIMSNAADLLWSVDEKRARTLYWDALNAMNLIAGPVRATGKNSRRRNARNLPRLIFQR